MNKRVFVAVPFDEESRRGIEKVQKILLKKHWPVKWEPVEKLHVTLAFLGNVEYSEQKTVNSEKVTHSEIKSNLDLIVDSARQAVEEMKQFEVGFKGLGSFPTLLLPTVVWVGLKGDLKSLAVLYKKLRTELLSNGFRLDNKPFRPHVTLGRIYPEAKRKVRLEMGKEIEKLRIMDIPQKLVVDRVAVFESTTGRAGSTYRILHETGLLK
jgi:2'-5' RNA ligase